ncbi:MAG: hypothetical protein M1820_002025 [Bogoriella megaspora]|nr:MAG: hypothetical protein M1820_002025 [Bogoriella megaspora]
MLALPQGAVTKIGQVTPIDSRVRILHGGQKDAQPCAYLFQWKPGYIVAVLNGDGSNRLGPFVDGDGSTATTGSSVLEARPATVSSGSSPATSSVAAGSTTASAISGSGTETVSITGSASPLSTSSTPSNSAQGDSVGRTVGLGVGIPVAAISAAGAIGFFFLYRRLKRAKTQNAESGGLPTRPTPSEKSFKISSPLEVAARGPQKPLPNFPPLELASHERSELDAVGNKKHVGLV